MKKIHVLLASCCLLLPSFAFAQNNKLQMVTYFPVPYVAYNDVTVTQFCEVGLLNQCQMNVGPGSPADRPFVLDVRADATNPANVLNTGQVNVTSGRLSLNSVGPSSKVYSQDAAYGVDAGVMGNVNSELQFAHVANVNAVNAPRSTTGTSSTLLRAMQIYPAKISNDFPGCASGATWKRLPLGYSGTSPDNQAYLVCGAKAGTGSCSGSKPATSQACSECGTQTRNVWCESGTWRTSSWTACPVKPNTTVSCGNAAYECGSSATRTVSCSGGTWTASAWNYSGCWNKYGGGQTRSCSAGCGTETSTATCSGASWSGSCWSPYGGYTSNCSQGCGQYGASSSCSGAVNSWNNCYYPYGGYTSNCSECGQYGASSSCSGAVNAWNSCYSRYGGGVQNSQSCGSGYNGTQYYRCDASCSGSTGCYWDRGACKPQLCTPNSTQSQGCGNCGSQSRKCSFDGMTWGAWSACSGQGVCSPGATSSQGCGNCGSQSRTCSGSCQWGSFGACGGQGACSPGSTGSQSCASGYEGSQSRTCSSSCQWGGWTGTCTPKKTYSVTTGSFDGAMVGSQACIGQPGYIRYVGSDACNGTDAYSVCNKVGNGGTCKVSSYCGYVSGYTSGPAPCSCRGTTYTCKIS